MGVILNNKKIIEGINIVANAVKYTMGREGYTFIIDNQIHPSIIKDGVNICKEIHLIDPIQNMGASMMQEAALKVLNVVGDNTTTTCVIAQALINKGQQLIDAGASHIEIREGVLKAKSDVIEMLNKLSRKTNKKDIYRIAKVAANGDEEVAKLIKKAYDYITLDGIVEVIGTAENKSTLEVNNGLKIDKGWFSNHFITDPVKHTAVLTNVKILVVDGNIPEDFVKLLMPAIKDCEKDNSSLFIICDEIHNSAVGALIKNKLNKTLSSCVIKNPFYGKERFEILKDIEAYTGAKMLKIGIDDNYVLGTSERIIVNENETIIQRDKKEEGLEEYIKVVKQSSNTEKRLSNLSSNLATLFVGANTPSEMGEKFERVEDAVLAVKSALSSSVCAGGGSSFHYISKKLVSNSAGYSLLLSAIQSPYKQILDNAGIKASWFKSLPEIKKYGEVYNIETKCLEDMELNGILDSTKGLVTALESAVSIAILILSTKGSITTDRK